MQCPSNNRNQNSEGRIQNSEVRNSETWNPKPRRRAGERDLQTAAPQEIKVEEPSVNTRPMGKPFCKAHDSIDLSRLEISLMAFARVRRLYPPMPKDRIAIIGIGCRFPGGVNDTESFWKLLVEGREALSNVPPDRWNIERFFDPEPGLPGKSIARRGGFLDGIDQFDPQFFGISPREAPYVDPQHRLILETAWEAIEDAGLVLDLERGTDLGVFVGISHNDYQGIQGTPWEHSGVSPHSPTGCAHSIAANRVSYCFNLRGPSVAMDTACSSALTAVHAACEYIRAGRGDMALAGGVTVMITPGGFIGFSQASMLSPDGCCKAFDASANGFVRGEGAGMVVLKRLSQAIEDGDPIHGVLIGTALNQDGHTNGISLPSAESQTRLVRDACADAEVAPSEIGFVEAHGTGTAVGDPIEAHALAEALCKDRSEEAPLLIGSVKTNLGHLETAAGVAGLVKALLVVKHGCIPASLHFQTPNPNIDFVALKLRVPTALELFPETNGRRVVGVNSFGFGGANAHVLLEEPPSCPQPEHLVTHAKRSWPLVISARSEAALRSSALRLSAWLDERSSANGSSPVLPDLAYTLGARRNHHPHRLSVVAQSVGELTAELNSYAAGQPSPKVQTAFVPRSEQAPRIVFVMSGQGPQWWGMGRELMQHEAVFRQTVERCDAAMRPWARFSLLEELGRAESASKMRSTEIAQPAIFAMQVALAELWKSWGIQPAGIIGHSVGEVAAACVAGVFSLEEAARVIVLRSRCMESCARGEGTMLAIGMGEEEARALIARHDRNLTIAAFNGPRSLTLAGSRNSLEAIAAELEPQEIFARFIQVEHPFHHPLMRPASEALEEALKDLRPHAEKVPFFSTVTGRRCAGETCDAAYWGRGVRQPVQFASAVGALADSGVDVWLELGVHPALNRSIQECLTSRGNTAPVISSVRKEREHESALETAMDLHRSGVALNFTRMTPARRVLSLPSYAWDKSRWWHEAADWRDGRLGSGGRGLLDTRLPRAMPTWISRLDGRHMAFLKDHKVDNLVVFPATGFIELVLEAGVQLFNGRPFVIEDLEIRKPLILPDPISGLQMELAYDPNERTFSILSKFEQGAAWSLHVVGSMRGERADASFASSAWENGKPVGTEPIEIEGFYQRLSDMGLRYGSEFRPIRVLSAGGGKSTGRVSLSEAVVRRANEYSVHPVLFDGALQIFSAAAATMEDRKAQLKLPVRFTKILFIRSPGASSLVLAGIQQCSNEYVEGRLALYDEEGKPCVLVDGFRAVSVSGGRRPGMQGGSRNVLYHLAWEQTRGGLRPARLRPVPLDQLRDAAQAALEEVVAMRGRTPLQNAMAAGDELAAAQLARGLQKMATHAGCTGGFTADSLRVAEPMRPVFGRLINSLAKRGWLEKRGDGHHPVSSFARAADSAEAMLRSFISSHSGHLPEAMLCSASCVELGPILRGEKDAVQVLFAGSSADLLEQFYGEGLYTSHWLAAVAATVKEAARHLPEGRGLRILEVGAGTGGLTSQVLPLLDRRVHSYIFSDISGAFFSAAMQKLAGFPEVEYKALDIEKPGTEQGFEAGSFDFVIGTNVLHAVSDLRSTLRHIYELLAPGGNLVFMDVANPQLWTEAVFGLTTGWWRFTDRDLRPFHPLLGRSRWEDVLRATGFSETASLAGLVGTEGEGQIGLLARKPWQEANVAASPVVETTPETPVENSWLIFADDSGLGNELASKLRTSGVRCRIARPACRFALDGIDDFTLRPDVLEDWKQLFHECADAPPERFVYLWSLDQPRPDAGGEAVLMGTDALLHLIQAAEILDHSTKVRIDLVTRGAQPAGQQLNVTSVAQAPVIGLLRVVLNEYPNFSGRVIDLPPEPSASDQSLLWSELLSKDAEREIALRGEARYVKRLVRGQSSREELLDPSVPLRLDSRERGHLDALRFIPFAMPACGADQVLIEVKAAGMNFRDVLKALALYPGEAPDARIFGDEVAGVVKAVGTGVNHVAPGERVFGLATFGLASHTVARGGDIHRIPGDLSFEQAATLPVVFMTAWHALHHAARLRKGERILVHAGAGGVGMAAIQIARYLGAEVIASAGNPAKRTLLQALGVRHVIDSRRSDFADEVMELTGRRGVDVVLNALAAEAIPMGLSCLGEFGRFVEIGKRDIYQNARLPLWPLRRNASFHVVAMDAVFAGDQALTQRMLEEISGLVTKGDLSPLPFRSFPACRVDAAFRLMAQGKHIGKILVAFPETFRPRRAKSLVPAFTVDPEGCYLITGAFGGFGKVLAQWLVECGARHLVLTSRHAGTTPEAEAFVKTLRASGVSVRVVRADIGLREDVARLTSEIRSADRPLRGLFHLAMVIDDAPLISLTSERMRKVVAPKAYGAWLLHEYTRDFDLDCFVMFSSVSSIFGNPAQGNYSAANAFLDSLAYHRRALGLPALTVNWGVLGGDGYVARNERVAEFLARQGTTELSPREVTSVLESSLSAAVAQVMAIRVDWSKWRQFFRGMQENPFLTHIFAAVEGQEADSIASDIRRKIEAASPEEMEGLIRRAVRDAVGSVLRVKPDTLRDDQPLTDLGLDSLMGVEIENSIEGSLGVALPPSSLIRARTISQIVAVLAEHIGAKNSQVAPSAGATPTLTPESASADEVNLEALSDEEIEGLLGADAAYDGTPESQDSVART
jgi:acyl transferase domain-containing protein/NADPH:quinone reductase-like Zn-dependent oxidoreductase/NAD(P)-dependent dehydrogenase (short-subunit alcohol dehydrogenase family)/SAM-dependent methyltransferase/acyl carrier protein